MKEKIINYIETLEAKSLQADDYFIQRNELYISNQEKDKEIEILNNIIKEVRELINYYGITPEQNDDTTCRSILKQFLGILDKGGIK